MLGQAPWSMLNQLTERNMDLWKQFQQTLLGSIKTDPLGKSAAANKTRTTR